MLQNSLTTTTGVFHADEDILFAERLTFVVEKVKALFVIGESSRFQENLTGVFGDDGEGVVSFADVNSD